MGLEFTSNGSVFCVDVVCFWDSLPVVCVRRLVFRKHLLYDALAEDIRGDSLVARCLVSVERALYIYPIEVLAERLQS